ncbi:unannotated protein [freshwater metagenome]|uniref:Unannotated protein n=1 Tax=freshwater metagenome TaxID=449393 RepID=A0A6J6AY90_9ZZZZ|nr:hypothetical protein [Actinomycetota bacterium]MSY78071.1 hypothetical protein [Actinomycetota bacterium]MTA63072.1 hypothetical protein [Actinomycetota bacterium]
MGSARTRVLKRFSAQYQQSAPCITVISPHFDDLPLSLGQSLRNGVLSRCQVRERVVFGRSSWTEWVRPTPERSPAISLWRRAEEVAASMMFGFDWTAAQWPEALLRRGAGFGPDMLDSRIDLSADALIPEISGWLEAVISSRQRANKARPEVLLVAAGLGGHIDHRLLAHAAAALVGQVDTPIGFYEDRPYVSFLSADQITGQLASLGLQFEAVDVSAKVQASTQAAARLCYPSQMKPFFREAMDLDRAHGACERVWFPVGTRPEWFGPS